MKSNNSQHLVENRVYVDYNIHQKVTGFLFYHIHIETDEYFFTGYSTSYYSKVSKNASAFDSSDRTYTEGDYIKFSYLDENNTLKTNKFRITFDANNMCQKLKKQEAILKNGFKFGLN